MRIFFAIEPNPPCKIAVRDWRARAFADLENSDQARAVPAANFHITLAFIGELPQRRLESLCMQVDEIVATGECCQGSILLDDLGYWPRPGILWLGPTSSPATLKRLAKRLRVLAGRTGGKRESKPFQAHLTLFRQCNQPPPSSLHAPEITLDYTEFSLLESRQGRHGVSYHPLTSWALT